MQWNHMTLLDVYSGNIPGVVRKLLFVAKSVVNPVLNGLYRYSPHFTYYIGSGQEYETCNENYIFWAYSRCDVRTPTTPW